MILGFEAEAEEAFFIGEVEEHPNKDSVKKMAEITKMRWKFLINIESMSWSYFWVVGVLLCYRKKVMEE